LPLPAYAGRGDFLRILTGKPMQIPQNRFKQRLLAGQVQYGLWQGLADPTAAELCANTGFDWLLLDGEHAPNDLRRLLAQLQAIAPYPSAPIVRPPVGDSVLIKQLLDIGAQTLLVPMVESQEQAQQLVRAMRYPPEGIRGVGASIARASRWNSVADYLHQTDAQMCLIVQMESRQGLENLEAICRVEGVDAVFIGPVDLSASLGHRGNPAHPEVQQVIEQAIAVIRSAGKPIGILCGDPAQVRRYRDLGVSFFGVGADTFLLLDGAKALRAKFA